VVGRAAFTECYTGKRDGVVGVWRKLHNEELHKLFPSLSVIRMIKSRRVKWAGHVVRMGRRRRMHMGFWWGKPEGKRQLGRPRCDVRIILKWILDKMKWYGLD
jgi:hypothetical protein